MLPALLLVFFFLIKPTIETVYTSLFETRKFSESDFKNKFIKDIETTSGKKVTAKSKFLTLHGSKKLVQKTEKTYSLKLKKNAINKNMSVKETMEYFILQIYTSRKKQGSNKVFIGLGNYLKMFKDSSMITAFKNNLLWLIFFTLFTTGFGLFLAGFLDRIKYSQTARSIIFLPMAISYVASGVIWSFMYAKDFGTINLIISFISKTINFIFGKGFTTDFKGIALLGRPDTVNMALILAGIWMWTGFCMVIFRAAIKSIPEEIINAAKIDGASSKKIFFKIQVPMILPTITVVMTTMIINVMKVFDIVYTMTGGGPFGSSEVIANRMYRTAFSEGNFEYASAMAVILLLAVIPVVLFNIKSFTYHEKIRD